MSPFEIAMLVGGGLVAGVINTLAGGGSLLTVPLLVLLGLPGTVANGTNRIGVLLQNAAAFWHFRREGVAPLRESLPVVIPVCVGSVIGASLISLASDALFNRLFGVVMLLLLIPTLRRPSRTPDPNRPRGRHARLLSTLGLFAVGLYGGAIQAGVGILLVLLLSAGGSGLVRANTIKVTTILALTAVAVPVFVIADQVAWAPALLLGLGCAAGGEIGARLTLRGGERLIRPVLAAAVLALAGRMLGLY